MGTVTKELLVEALEINAKLTPAQAQRAVDSLFGVGSRQGLIATYLGKGLAVTLPNFGRWRPKWQSSRKFYDIATGRVENTEAHWLVKFRAAQGLTNAVSVLPDSGLL
jgi:nucleoid DNA-binding protein